MVKDIITKLKQEKLLGKSGSFFPTGLKWEIVKKAKAKQKYIVCNAAEGELHAFKDRFILENYPQEIIGGIKIALKTIDNSLAYIYLRKDYYQTFKKSLERLIKGLPITLVKKGGGYLAGEETVLCNTIEGKRPEPRLKPPYPGEVGIRGFPTLVNNIETFYWVFKIAKGEYKRNRFYSIAGDIKNGGVYELPEGWTIKKILRETNNYPNFDFFIQAGGGSSGEFLLPNELNQKVQRLASLIVFERKKNNPLSLMKSLTNFYLEENCDKCVPCREGIYRIDELLKKNKIDKSLLKDILFVLKKTSFCPFAAGAANALESLNKKLIK